MRTNELQYQFEKYMFTVESAKEEVQAAQFIQQMLLHDDVPYCDALSCVGVSIPSFHLSGDYYDFIHDERNGRYWVFIGDVMGKGIPAFLLMVLLRSTVRCLTRTCASPGKLVFELNNSLHKDLTRLRAFASLFCGMFDTNSAEFLYTSAGHPSPILMRKNRDFPERLEGKGTVIGILRNREYKDYSILLSKGDLIVGCTDGIFEAMDTYRQQYGYDRLMQVISKNKDQTMDDLIQSITSDVKQYSQDFKRDDVTVIAIRCEKGEVNCCSE
ncbi:PP2C family protein-serine/threonine phosphatase [Effusibacillus pohliae]|uniref:PP2C family protein-serine/threonine phosphatase n=1 Tax=Effusibacillus pohliae TaxID=232270 RepID=UPI0014613FB3|nr:PP2C family protein-serine/threonine phosphatase [Effusibacillus pohliae]